VVLLARVQTPALPDATEVQSGALLLVPEAGGAPKIAAEFPFDAPFGDLQAPAFDERALYWLNTSGNLYSLDVAALEFP
jgi:hypothetical protein